MSRNHQVHKRRRSHVRANGDKDVPLIVCVRAPLLLARLHDQQRLTGESTLTRTTERLLIEKLAELNGGTLSPRRRASRSKFMDR